MKYFNYFIIGVVALAIVTGFFMVGSPVQQRQLQFDDRRVNDLSYLQSEILAYWQNKGKLPTELALLNDDLRGFRVPLDPESTQPYSYEVKGETTFALCAVFNLPSLGQAANLSADLAGRTKPVPAGYYGDPFMGQSSWEHQAGLTCFERTIDKDYYKLKQPID